MKTKTGKMKKNFTNLFARRTRVLFLRRMAICALSIFSLSAYANNIIVSNVTSTAIDSTTAYIQFDLSWDNSWRISSGAQNWDAAWVFFKFNTGSRADPYAHCKLSSSSAEHQAAAGSQIDGVPDSVGVFIYRSASGTPGTNTWTGLKVKWIHGGTLTVGGDCINISGFAIEMVYVSQGAFSLGDGSTTGVTGQFRDGAANVPLRVTGVNSVVTLGGTTAGNLANNNASGMGTADDFNNTTTKTLPATFPNGFKSFYCMKYEVMSKQYAGFLNNLTSTQATAHSGAGGDIGTWLTGSWPNYTLIAAYTYRVANYLSWSDLTAFLAWAGLRPMTELEYEKAARGTALPFANEYAWGNTNIFDATGYVSSGISETLTPPNANCSYNNTGDIQIRPGVFAAMAATPGPATRQQSGATYWGIMEMSGSQWERTIGIGHPNGRAFTGTLGSGVLTAAGDAVVTDWPNNLAVGTGHRGGSWSNLPANSRISDRTFTANVISNRPQDFGGRGVR
jgi:formylglycine-generating enzyme required for sulfatase activity